MEREEGGGSTKIKKVIINCSSTNKETRARARRTERSSRGHERHIWRALSGRGGTVAGNRGPDASAGRRCGRTDSAGQSPVRISRELAREKRFSPSSCSDAHNAYTCTHYDGNNDRPARRRRLAHRCTPRPHGRARLV